MAAGDLKNAPSGMVNSLAVGVTYTPWAPPAPAAEPPAEPGA
jgi:hypothetical protein